MDRRIIGGVVSLAVLGVGYFTAGNGYAGHDDPTGTYCQQALKINNDMDADLRTIDKAGAKDATGWQAMAARMSKGAADFRALDTTEVKPDVASAVRSLAASWEAMVAASDENAVTAADLAGQKALRDMAKTCNDATGEKVGVKIEK